MKKFYFINVLIFCLATTMIAQETESVPFDKNAFPD